ncbi:MAG: TPR repeat-containing protein [Rhodospirillaceae bacterium]|nr:MAG: TPR repeat-containing protein [Rhodospirillaceae bacterium]
MSITRKWVVRTVRHMVGVAMVAFLPVACGGSGSRVAWPVEDVTVAAVTPGESQVGAYLAGHHALQMHDLKTASAYYRRALQIDPTNINLLKRTYTLLAAEGDIGGSIAVVQKLQALKVKDPVATLILTVKAAQNEDYAEVERLMAAQPRHGLNSFVGPLMMAWAQAGQGQVDAALRTVASLKKSDPLLTLYNFHSGMINDLAGRPRAAAVHYAATVTAEGGLSLRTLEVIGAFYLRIGQQEKTQALYERYLKEHPGTVLLDGLIQGLNDGATPARPIADARNGLAETLFGAANTVREENAADASLLLGRLALAMQADFPLAQILVGDLLQAQARSEEANAAYQAIGRNSVVYYSVQLRVAENLYKAGTLHKAIAALESLAQQWPDRPEAFILLGDIWRNEKRFVEATLAYEKALARIQVVEDRHWNLFYSRGIAYEQAQRWTAAEKDFLKALDLAPNHPLVLNYLGYSWLERRHNIHQAKNMIQQAVKQRPEDGFIVDSLGWALYLTGDYPGAVQELERAVELEPNDPTINEHLGDAYWHVSRRKEARFQWQRALSLNPEGPDLRTILHRKLERGLVDTPDIPNVPDT